MDIKIYVILARAEWCGHCQKFEPVYNVVKEIYKKNDFLTNYEIQFDDYNLADDNIRNTFLLNHGDISDKVQFYPTIFVGFKNKKNKTIDYITIEHTAIPNEDELKLQELRNDEKKYDALKKKLEIECAKKFISNIINGIKSFESDNKILYTQAGGSKLMNVDESIYKNKYLKYKTKYLKLKNNQ